MEDEFKGARATRLLEIDAGHRVPGHEGKCASYHGHRYRFEVTIATRAGGLDGCGRVVDFGDIKVFLGSWLDHEADHAMILRADDPLLCARVAPAVLSPALRTLVARGERDGWRHPLCGAIAVDKERYLLLSVPPTAENLARLVYLQAAVLLGHNEGLQVAAVRCWETPNCYADWTREMERAHVALGDQPAPFDTARVLARYEEPRT